MTIIQSINSKLYSTGKQLALLTIFIITIFLFILAISPETINEYFGAQTEQQSASIAFNLRQVIRSVLVIIVGASLILSLLRFIIHTVQTFNRKEFRVNLLRMAIIIVLPIIWYILLSNFDKDFKNTDSLVKTFAKSYILFIIVHLSWFMWALISDLWYITYNIIWWMISMFALQAL